MCCALCVRLSATSRLTSGFASRLPHGTPSLLPHGTPSCRQADLKQIGAAHSADAAAAAATAAPAAAAAEDDDNDDDEDKRAKRNGALASAAPLASRILWGGEEPRPLLAVWTFLRSARGERQGSDQLAFVRCLQGHEHVSAWLRSTVVMPCHALSSCAVIVLLPS